MGINTNTVLTRGLRLAERVAVVTTMVATVLAAGLSAVFLVRDTLDVSAGVARITVPALADLDTGVLGPRVESGSYGDVNLSIVDAPDAARSLLVIATLLVLATVLITCVAVFLLCLSLLRGRPFGRSVTGVWFLVAVVMIGVGIAGPLLRGEASRIIIGSLTLGTPGSPIGLGDTAFYVVREVNAFPLVIGLVLLVVAGAFAVGSRLRRETQGLI